MFLIQGNLIHVLLIKQLFCTRFFISCILFNWDCFNCSNAKLTDCSEWLTDIELVCWRLILKLPHL